jgi:hypothetical protein
MNRVRVFPRSWALLTVLIGGILLLYVYSGEFSFGYVFYILVSILALSQMAFHVSSLCSKSGVVVASVYSWMGVRRWHCDKAGNPWRLEHEAPPTGLGRMCVSSTNMTFVLTDINTSDFERAVGLFRDAGLDITVEKRIVTEA